jgi:GT2 family glycosyltransferase
VPLWEGAASPVTASLRLSAPRPVTVEVATAPCGPAVATVEVGPMPRAVEVEARGPAFDVIQNAGSLLLEGGYGADRGFLQPDRGQLDEATDVWAWCGGAVLLRRRYLEDVGLFWPPYFMYYEDTDLAWRGRAVGWRYRYEPRAVVRHLHGMSAGEGSALFDHYVERNRLVVLTRNAPAGMALAATGRAALTAGSLAGRDALTSLRARRVPRFVATRRRVASLAAYGRLLPRLLADRRRLRRRQSVPDAELMAWARPRSSHPA